MNGIGMNWESSQMSISQFPNADMFNTSLTPGTFSDQV